MYRIGKYKVWAGDFHGQFVEEVDNLPLNLSALSICGYDFSLFNTGDTSPNGPFPQLVRKLGIPFYILPYGRELFYEWAHIMVGGLKPDAQIPASDNNDYIGVLHTLRPLCEFISLAHPYENFIGCLDEVLDAGLVDAVAYRNLGEPKNFCEWYRDRMASGKKTPIVAELDFHVSTGKRKNLISYQTCQEASQDLAPCGKKYTLVFSESCTPEAIYEAVRNGRSVVDIEDHLFGESQWIHILENGGYLDRKHVEMKRRESLRLALDPGVIPTCGEPFTVHIQQNGKEEDILIRESQVPINEARYYLPFVVDEQCRCVKIRPAVECRLLPSFHNKNPIVKVQFVSNSMIRTFTGKFTLDFHDGTEQYSDVIKGLAPGMKNEFSIPLPSTLLHFASSITGMVHLRLDGMPVLKYSRELIFFSIPYSKDLREEDWTKACSAEIDKSSMLDTSFLPTWNGPEDCSAKVRFLWNEEALYFRADITDTVLAPALQEDLLFFGDCIQIAINPIDDPQIAPFSFYHFIATRGGFHGRQKEFCEVWNVPDFPMEAHRKPKFRLPDFCYKLLRTDETHSTLLLTFPWSFLPMIYPHVGTRFQIHLILWDKDREGVKCALQWPRPGIWYKPSDHTWVSAELM